MVAGQNRALQRAVLALERIVLFRFIFKLYYKAGALLFTASTRARFPEAQKVFLRRGQTSQGWVPGASDLDFGLVLRESADADFLRRFWSHYAGWKRVFPVLGEVQIVDREQEPLIQACAGRRLREYGGAESSGWRRRWEFLGESLFSCLNLLEQTYFEDAEGAAPDFGHKIAKGYLDTVRFAEACDQDAPPPARRAFLAALPDSGLKASLGAPHSLSRPAAGSLCFHALSSLDAACRRFVEQTAAEGFEAAPAPAPSSWEPPLPNSDLFLWRKRLGPLTEPRFGRVHGACFDGLMRWHVVGDVGDAESARRLFEHLDSMRRGDSTYAAAPWVLTKPMMQALLWTVHLGTPFFHWAISPRLGPLGVAARKRSRLALGAWAQRVQWRLEAGDFAPPPKLFLRYGLEQSVAEAALSLGLFGRSDWGGENAFRLYFLYSRLMSALLYLRRGVAADPEDLDALIDAFAQGLPEDYARIRQPLESDLALPPDVLNDRSRPDVFYRHYGALRSLCDAALQAVSRPG